MSRVMPEFCRTYFVATRYFLTTGVVEALTKYLKHDKVLALQDFLVAIRG
jgi:hypothetical protein